MGFFDKLFGGGASLTGLRKAYDQKRFVDARLIAEQLLAQSQPEPERIEIEQLLVSASDALARLNLQEALGFQRAGDQQRAAEHLQLAEQQARSEALLTEISCAARQPELVAAEPASAKSAGSSCASCGPQALEPVEENDLTLPDSESQLELILMAYPPQLAERYRQKQGLFVQAFLLSHCGRDNEALPLWQQVDVTEQDALYLFEYGAAQARAGQSKDGRQALEKALQIEPDLWLASESLVQLLISLGDADAARQHLQQLLKKGQDPAFCHVQLTLVALQQQQPVTALEHARQALALGVADGNFLQLSASLLEQAGDIEAAEAVLSRLPGGGCGGGISLPLAEFLLRQKRDLGKVLDAFNAACRQDPQNPRWQLRAAQTYLARNWNREGLELLRKVVGDPQLDPELRQEAEALLADRQD